MVCAGEIAQVVAIATLCDEYRVDESTLVEGCERWVRGRADGTPSIGEFLAADIGATLGVSSASGMVRIGQVLNVRHRHDGHCDVWGRVDAADGIVFDQALNAIAATLTDEHLGGLPGNDDGSPDGGPVRAQMSRDQRRAAAVGILARAALGQPELPRTAEIIVRIDATTDLPALDAMADAEPPAVVCGDMLTGEVLEGVDRALPDAVVCGDVGAGETEMFARGSSHPARTAVPDGEGLVRHGRAFPGTATMGPGGVRDETPFAGLVLAPVAEVQGWGAVLTSQLGRLLDGCRVTVRPVIEARQVPAARGYEIPDAIRLAVTERWPVDAFPYGTTRSTGCDLDHSRPYGDGGKTHVDNLAPLKRFAHRVRTHGGWKLEQTEPGRLIWTSPHGYTYAVTPAGTVRIGRPPPSVHDWWNQEPPDWLAP